MQQIYQLILLSGTTHQDQKHGADAHLTSARSRRLTENLWEILSVFRQVKPELKIDWTALVAVSPKHELIEGLRQLQQDWNLDLSGTRLTNNLIDRTWIEDAYIYQIK
jgi:hypothetical protein